MTGEIIQSFLFKHIVDTSLKAVSIFTKNGIPVYANNSFLNLHDIASEKLLKNFIPTISDHLEVTDETGAKVSENCNPYFLTSLEFKQKYFSVKLIKSGKKWNGYYSLYSLTFMGNEYRVITIYEIPSEKITQTEKALVEAEKKYRELVTFAPAAIYEIDFRTRRFTSVNDAMILMTGYSKEELLNMDAFNIIDEKGRKLFASRIDAFFKGENLEKNPEYRIKTKSGDCIEVILNATFTTDKLGNAQGAMVIAHDITERKKVQRTLEKTLQQRQLALDAAEMGWWHYNPITKISNWDDRYREIFSVSGYQKPNDEILNQLIFPEDLNGLWEKVEMALNPLDPKPFYAQYRINRPDGEIRWIEAHGIASFEGEDAEKHAISFVGTVADITEKKHAEELLIHHASLVDNMFEAVISTDTRYNILSWNKAAEKMYGWTAEEVLGKSSVDVFKTRYTDTNNREKVLADLENCGTWSGEVIQEKKDGSLIFVSASLNILKDKEGRINGIIAINRDITKEKKQ
ncbi:MAG: PAS domain S-box protein [Bacteroidales bacterium]|nr:PAS domain S-box protein [Bacteroidales bacterium]